MVDRRMINNFLVSYADPKADDKVKTHMLDAMSKILGFSMEEKQKLGMVARPDGHAEEKQSKASGFGSSLVNFLMGDDDFD
jgi:hypothetical protein